jgi:peptidoglycan/xylan/chitin deacetylase (PgdA/CDA1 family)
MKRILVLLMLWAGSVGASDVDDRHAVILLYHHVAVDTPASTSVTPERFEAHLDWLAREQYRVWPLERLLAAVIDGAEPVPEDVVAITFDDAYESVHDAAAPRLAARGWPYTVFVNTDAIDAGHAPYMGWAQLRELAGRGAEIGNHSAAHGHMARPRDDESRAAWRERIRADIGRSHERIAEEIGREPGVFAYPYGEDSPELAELVGERYPWALVQRSGAAGPLTDPLAVPRFPMATGFASLDRLALAARSRPLPVRDVETGGRGERGDLAWIRLTLAADGFSVARLACFSAGGDALDLDVESGPPDRVRIDVAGIGRPGRNKVNCTAPADDGSGTFYWYAHQWLVDR